MTLTAFDSDVLIYAATQNHPIGRVINSHLTSADTRAIGSVLLLTEVLAKPMRLDSDSDEVAGLQDVLSRIALQPIDEPTGQLALDLAIAYRLRAADAAHLATAVSADADQFLTNNRKDFPKTIAEIDVVYPEDLVN